MKESGILQVIQYVSREKSMPVGLLFEMLEQTIEDVMCSKYGTHKFKCHFDRKTGQSSLYRVTEVVSDEDAAAALQDGAVDVISISEAKKNGHTVEVGDKILEEVPMIDIEPSIISKARTALVSKIRKIEAERELEEYSEKIGEMFSGVVERVERAAVVIKLANGVLAVIPHNHQLRQDNFVHGAKVKAVLVEVKQSQDEEPQLILSRTSDTFLEQLLHREVAEIYSGTIRIVKIAREAGSRSKVVLYSSVSSINPVGACIGIKGARVKAVMAELGGEKIDFILYSDDMREMVLNAIAPVVPQKVSFSEDEDVVKIVVGSGVVHEVIGRNGQNVRLLSMLIGMRIEVMTEQDLISDAYNKTKKDSLILQKRLDIDMILAQVLISEKLNTVEKIAETSVSDLSVVVGEDTEIAEELISRANLAIQLGAESYADLEEDKSSQATMSDVPGVTSDALAKEKQMMIRAFARLRLSSLARIAPYSSDELYEMCNAKGFDIRKELLDVVVTKARQKTYFSIFKNSDAS
ncbi:Transcription termination/antitermination protein NusA [Candidatus Fokinia solitaria]|uniref:Transcription termination/antitermination protein NusA n=1 Tax=Candidatus Fokinia solitaria TaxID=1802984 RepID=A0A2U8BSG5_9RICK|nr:transcription termination factor NusA [Candidatus Fokinia solitaria]AWD33281.1 Transcription termination/antitermination protein NusA [Candidatus Fokinia solitaria]